MPVNFGILAGGMLTSIGTSTNLLILSIAADLGMQPMGIFDFSSIALLSFAVALPYLWLVAPRLLPDNTVRDPGTIRASSTPALPSQPTTSGWQDARSPSCRGPWGGSSPRRDRPRRAHPAAGTHAAARARRRRPAPRQRPGAARPRVDLPGPPLRPRARRPLRRARQRGRGLAAGRGGDRPRVVAGRPHPAPGALCREPSRRRGRLPAGHRRTAPPRTRYRRPAAGGGRRAAGPGARRRASPSCGAMSQGCCCSTAAPPCRALPRRRGRSPSWRRSSWRRRRAPCRSTSRRSWAWWRRC